MSAEAGSGGAPVSRAVVFGGTGFVGRRVVHALAAAGADVVVAARRPGADEAQPTGDRVRADVTSPASLRGVLRRGDAVVNCVGCYVEAGGRTFASVHVDGARHVAEAARVAGAASLVHVSGIGADASSGSPYIRARGAGEDAVRAAVPAATVLRPSMIFGTGGDALQSMAAILRAAPVFPLFGDGATCLQPVFVDDVAHAVVAAAIRSDAHGRTYELGGPERVAYRDLVRRVRRMADARAAIIPMPLGAWRLLAALTSRLQRPPVTEGMVALMARDNIVGDGVPGLADLGVRPASLADVAADRLNWRR